MCVRFASEPTKRKFVSARVTSVPLNSAQHFKKGAISPHLYTSFSRLNTVTHMSVIEQACRKETLRVRFGVLQLHTKPKHCTTYNACRTKHSMLLLLLTSLTHFFEKPTLFDVIDPSTQRIHKEVKVPASYKIAERLSSSVSNDFILLSGVN